MQVCGTKCGCDGCAGAIGRVVRVYIIYMRAGDAIKVDDYSAPGAQLAVTVGHGQSQTVAVGAAQRQTVAVSGYENALFKTK